MTEKTVRESDHSVQTYIHRKVISARRHLDLSVKDAAEATTFIMKSEATSQQRGLLDRRMLSRGDGGLITSYSL